MAISYLYGVNAKWQAKTQGIIEGESGVAPLSFSAPEEFQGEAGFWTPERFFLAAIASCFITTFRAVAELSKFEPLGLEVSAEGTVEKGEGGFSFTRATLKPRLDVERAADLQRGERLLEKTERACLVSRSVKTDIHIEPVVEVAAIQAT